jgi:hypothetical protein
MDILQSSEPTQQSLNTLHGLLSSALSDDDGEEYVARSTPYHIQVSPAPPRAPRFAHQRVQYFRTMELHLEDTNQGGHITAADEEPGTQSVFRQTAPPPKNVTVDGAGDIDDDGDCSSSLTQMEDQGMSPMQFVKIKLPSEAKINRYPLAVDYVDYHENRFQSQSNDIFQHSNHGATVSSSSQERPFMRIPTLAQPLVSSTSALASNRWRHPHGRMLFAPSAEGGERFLLSPRRSSNATTPAENGCRSDDDDDSLRTTSPTSSTLMPGGGPSFVRERPSPPGVTSRSLSFAPPCLRRDHGLALEIPDFGRMEAGTPGVHNGAETEQFILYDN